MPDRIRISVNGARVEVLAGTTVAAAVMLSGVSIFRQSVSGTPRGPVCGMGICFECRVTIDGVSHRRSCQLECAEGMQVVTG
jgi:predicted molibdopterin-dependent oxidoreductase YjgC